MFGSDVNVVDFAIDSAILVVVFANSIVVIERNLDPNHLIGPLEGVVVESPGEIGAPSGLERDENGDDGEMTGKSQFLRQRRYGLVAKRRIRRIAVDPVWQAYSGFMRRVIILLLLFAIGMKEKKSDN